MSQFLRQYIFRIDSKICNAYDQGMKLKNYLDRNGISRRAFAEHFDVHQATIFRWERGTVPPKWAMAKIVELTGGKVKPQDFYELKAAS